MTHAARLWCAVLATDGVLAFATAAYLWGVIAEPSPEVHVAVSHDRRPRCPSWIRLHRVRVAPSAVTMRAHLPVTTRTWAILDYLGTLGQPAAMALADRAVQRGWLRPVDVSHRLETYRGRSGNAVLRPLREALADGAAAQSERLLHRILRRAGVTGWRPNHDVWPDGDLIAVVDVAFPELRIAIEVDGHAYHSDVERFRRDRQRQNALVALGWTVLRFTWADLTERPGYVMATIRHILAGSGTHLRA